jgi:uncharacterized protein (TIGR00288 family)
VNIPTTNTSNTRIAVFIDFDNVEIGVKNTIGGQFDIGLILEAIKERGEIVTKVAYSDWKRAGDYSRVLTQHAIRMVQRNMTPGGDKNGADITMALDALEMAFTHDHINAFVIVGGDSDFISLVEKLKQYGRKVIVVGGRQFTSMTMQKNCHEFIAYENLVGSGRGGGRSSERGGKAAGGGGAASDMSKVLPLVKRALKVLSEREVAPQLGLLKSTLLQLDSTFSEREYGAGSFRDFMEKVAQTGAVTLKNAGRSMMVESREDGDVDVSAPHHAAAEHEHEPAPRSEPVAEAAAPIADADADEDESLPASPMTMQDGIRAVQIAFGNASPAPRWPMYVRQAKQFLKSHVEAFDERKYGFASVVDLLRAAGKEGVLRVERDRHGAVRVFPGAKLAAAPPMPDGDESMSDIDEMPAIDAPDDLTEHAAGEQVSSADAFVADILEEAPIIDAQAIEVPAGNAAPAKKTARKRKAAAPRPKTEKAEKPAKPRARKTARTKSEAADR